MPLRLLAGNARVMGRALFPVVFLREAPFNLPQKHDVTSYLENSNTVSNFIR